MAPKSRSRLIVALDFDRLAQAESIARQLAGVVAMFKVGSQLFTAEGPRAVERLSRFGPGIFLDLKFHDIPNTVAGAVSSAAGLPGVKLVNVHALGGYKMMDAAVRALPGGPRRPRLLAVTVLTSLDAAEFELVGIRGLPAVRALKLARLARRAGLDGVVSSAHEARDIRRACGEKFLIVVPGIRPTPVWPEAAPRVSTSPHARHGGPNDQVRVATPAEAIRAGADYVVIGRPITGARDPCAAVASINAEIAAAL